jgi:hypothetical protein
MRGIERPTSASRSALSWLQFFDPNFNLLSKSLTLRIFTASSFILFEYLPIGQQLQVPQAAAELHAGPEATGGT